MVGLIVGKDLGCPDPFDLISLTALPVQMIYYILEVAFECQ